MKPMPFNRRAFLKSAVANHAAALANALPRKMQPEEGIAIAQGTSALRSRLTPEEQALIRAAVDQRIAAGERSLL